MPDVIVLSKVMARVLLVLFMDLVVVELVLLDVEKMAELV
tara:strand:+ start:425 stop:544 length:120 start_codon:yes stop_codon:yes gene_type:complete